MSELSWRVINFDGDFSELGQEYSNILHMVGSASS